MFFVTLFDGDRKTFGPYWHRKVAVSVLDAIEQHYSSMGIPVIRKDRGTKAPGWAEEPLDPIVLDLLERQMVHESKEWRSHLLTT